MIKTDRPNLSPEAKALIGKFVAIQIEKYGPDWKAKLAKEMAAQTVPVMEAFIRLQKTRPAR